MELLPLLHNFVNLLFTSRSDFIIEGLETKQDPTVPRSHGTTVLFDIAGTFIEFQIQFHFLLGRRRGRSWRRGSRIRR